MLIPLAWLVLFFFIVIAVVFILIYEVDSKFKWKEEANNLTQENLVLKNKKKDTSSLLEEYGKILNNLQKKLTDRQFEVFLYTIDGLSSKEIGDKLHIAPSTIDWHIKDIKTKLEVEKRSQFAGILIKELKQSINKDGIPQNMTSI